MKKNKSLSLPFNKNKSTHRQEGAYIISDSTSFSTLESYKTARTNIMFSLPKTDDGKIILISSSVPAEGKTTTSINLAHTFAQTGAKVLLVDCDMRKPRVHRYLKISKDIGLSNVLCGFCSIDDAIQKNVFGDMDCIPVGEIPLNSAELLMSEEMKKLLTELSKRYDYVFIDTPPIMTVTDAMIIAPLVSGVVIVIRQNLSSFDMVDRTVEVLRRSNIKILGFLMNNVEKTKTTRYYKSRRYGYNGYTYSYSNEYTDGGIKNKQ